MLNSPTFIKRFDQAAGLSRAGKHDRALEAFLNIHDPFEDKDESRVMTGEFMAHLEMRKGYCLMDLGKYNKALEMFDSDIMQACLGQLSTPDLYFYHLSRGNTLGNLGRLDDMEAALGRAVELALDPLDDVDKWEQGWYWIMHWVKEWTSKRARKTSDWDRLEATCIAAHKFGVEHGSYWLQHTAGEFGCHAYRGQGRIEKARKGAEVILGRLKEARADKKRLKVWKQFLADLGKAD